MTEPGLLVASIEANVRYLRQSSRTWVRAGVQVDKNVRLLHSDGGIPVVVPSVRILGDRSPGEDDCVWPLVIDGVGPTVRIFEDAVCKPSLEAVKLPVNMLDAILHISGIRTGTEEIILIVEPKIAANFRCAHVQPQL